jgi:hypothetical protein
MIGYVNRGIVVVVLSLEEMSVDFRVLMHLHFLHSVSESQFNEELFDAYHLEGVEFLLDLLSEHWRQTVACCNLASSIIFAAWPSIMKLNARAEGSITFDSTRWSIWDTLRVAAELQRRHEVVLPTNGNRICPLVSMRVIIWSAWSR